ncbi:hypothetical protein V5O48_007984 [Marasmius crinis-equi]|uniref:RING-type domain-containing protein n=1 Tax=Marasmius crinis-equi TaxID=585013 RepID=A0ABR3FFA9_9AGAR
MQTRGSKNLAKSKAAEEPQPGPSVNGGVNDDDIEEQIEGLLRSAKKMKREMERLREQNSELQQQLDDRQNEETQDAKRGRATNGRHAKRKLTELEKKNRELEKANIRLRKKIDSFKVKELKREADELQGEEDDELDEVDATHQMRKLLRKISDLLAINALPDEGEDCAICMERMEPNKTSSLECQHLVCNSCLPGISKPGEDETVQCPHCRKVWSRDSVETVQFTETERWDELLECANTWGTLDAGHRGEENTSEEEASEDFIDDSEDQTSGYVAHLSLDAHSLNERYTSQSRAASQGPTTADSDSEEPTTPPNTTSNYARMASPQKRARMERLAAERDTKRRRK